jgi:hypothetical protein
LGLAFDGNYEALSHKIAFDKDLNRTICVDVRYVLWCIDKLGGAVKYHPGIETGEIDYSFNHFFEPAHDTCAGTLFFW